MNVGGIVLVTVVAVTVEALVEYVKTAVLSIKGDKVATILQMAALAVSVTVCLLCGADIYGAVGIVFRWQPIGCILTGVFTARGANYISDFVGRIQAVLS